MKNNKPYLVTCASYTEGCGRFIDSLRNMDNTADYFSVEFIHHFPEKPPHSARILIDEVYPGHMRRLEYIPISFLDLERWVIFCDTDDVLIQKTIPQLPEDKDFLIANENVIHKDSFWFSVIKQFPMFECLLDK